MVILYVVAFKSEFEIRIFFLPEGRRKAILGEELELGTPPNLDGLERRERGVDRDPAPRKHGLHGPTRHDLHLLQRRKTPGREPRDEPPAVVEPKVLQRRKPPVLEHDSAAERPLFPKHHVLDRELFQSRERPLIVTAAV